MLEESIAKKLKALRKKNFLSVNDVSKMFHEIQIPISIKTIYKWESGEIVPDIETLVKLSYFYNESISYFFENKKRCQALTDSELEFINKIRSDREYKKIALMICRRNKEEKEIEK